MLVCVRECCCVVVCEIVVVLLCESVGVLLCAWQETEGAAQGQAARLWAALAKLQSPFHIGRVVQAAVHVDGPDSLSVRLHPASVGETEGG